MRIVLSRKGFDSTNGGIASPVFEDGSAVSLPIPGGRRAPLKLSDLRAPGTAYGGDLGTLAEQLGRGRVRSGTHCHLDPDLETGTGPEVPGWEAAFGQVGAAQRHLEYERVGRGDLFLFFGWFRDVEEHAGAYRYRRGGRSVHRLFGWLQVGEVLRVEDDTEAARRRRPGLGRHPHLWGRWAPTNTVYVAADMLTLDGAPAGTAGAGLFGRDEDGGRLTLTAGGAKSRSEWRLPAGFGPIPGRKGLTYHRDAARWRVVDGESRVRAAARGQEFVIDANEAPEAIGWAAARWRDGGEKR